ncbi:MAG: hypothetical protein HON90_11865 [Halobacteriovoraceae bacterium]|jgi:hypothetical protein|nr:hypothetical protein [Halobacteriovoraceae bacterium]
MKNLKKLFLLSALVLSIVSCGSDNKSGGSGGGTTPAPAAPVAPDWYQTDTDVQNLNNYNRLRDFYVNKSFANGLTDNMVIYHIGRTYSDTAKSLSNNNTQNIGLSDIFHLGYCINFFGILKGDCANTNSSYTATQTDLGEIVRQGEYKVIGRRDHNQVDLSIAQGSDNYGFLFEAGVYDRGDNLYNLMLNLAGKTVRRVVISKAEVYVTDANGNNTRIDADFVEYFFTDSSIRGYVISQNLPSLANPIAVTANTVYDTHELTGALSFSGVNTVKSISVQTHRLNYTFQTNSYTEVDSGRRSIQF